MVSIKNIQWEFRLALIFGISAFVLSPIVGFITGNPVLVVLIRAVIFSIVFALIGYGSIFVIKKFVPEFYDAVFSDTGNSRDAVDSEITDEGISEFSSDSVEEPENSEEGFEEGDSGEMENPDSGLSLSDTDTRPSRSGRKMGRHLLEEKGMKFEPKLMAEAIRTMMAKDDD